MTKSSNERAPPLFLYLDLSKDSSLNKWEPNPSNLSKLCSHNQPSLIYIRTWIFLELPLHEVLIPNTHRGKTVQIFLHWSDLNFASPRGKLWDATMCPSINHFLVLRPKPVKPIADGFEAQTTKPSIIGFENQTGKPSYTPRKVWLIDVDACLTFMSSTRGPRSACDTLPWLGPTSS
jgi:hypothetical protein